MSHPALLFNANRIRCLPDDRLIRFSLALLLLMNGIPACIYAMRWGVHGLPLHLCDLALFVMIWTLLKPNRYVGELAYFWGLAGSWHSFSVMEEFF